MNQIEKMAKKTNFGSDFGGPNLDPQNFFSGFISSRCYTLLQAIIISNFLEN